MNEEFAHQAKADLEKSFIRNSSEKKKEHMKFRTTSLDFKKVKKFFYLE